jgi:F0F1-type ATP synthase assembly protein I
VRSGSVESGARRCEASEGFWFRVTDEAVVADRRREEVSDGRRFGGAYQGAFEAVFAIVIGAGLGFAADRRYETDPWGVLIGIGLGFGAFVLRLVRLGRAMQEAERKRRDDADGSGGGGE